MLHFSEPWCEFELPLMVLVSVGAVDAPFARLLMVRCLSVEEPDSNLSCVYS